MGRFYWTPEMDDAIRAGYAIGTSTVEIGRSLGVTKNAVIGRAFRLHLFSKWTTDRLTREPKVRLPRKPRSPRPARPRQFTRWTPEALDQLRSLAEQGSSLTEMSFVFGKNVSAIYSALRTIGLARGKAVRRFTAEEDAAIREQYAAYVPIEDIARNLNRTFGVIRQRIFHQLHLHRNMYVSIYLKRAPELASFAQVGGEEAFFKALEEWKRDQKERRARELVERERHFQETLAAELKRYGRQYLDRNDVIRLKRSLGMRLEEIGREHGMTRERVRQICAKQPDAIFVQPYPNAEKRPATRVLRGLVSA